MPTIEPTGLWQAQCFLSDNGSKLKVAHIIAFEGGIESLCGVKGDCSVANRLTVEQALSTTGVDVCNDCRMDFLKREIGYKDKDPT